jgi:hypothetical protein
VAALFVLRARDKATESLILILTEILTLTLTTKLAMSAATKDALFSGKQASASPCIVPRVFRRINADHFIGRPQRSHVRGQTRRQTSGIDNADAIGSGTDAAASTSGGCERVPAAEKDVATHACGERRGELGENACGQLWGVENGGWRWRCGGKVGRGRKQSDE